MDKKNIEAIYHLSPSQQGMLFESLSSSGFDIHFEQSVWLLKGNVNAKALELAFQEVVNRHPILRTAFVWKDQIEPIQVVLREVGVFSQTQDWRKMPASEQQEALEEFLNITRQQGFNFAKAPLLNLAIFQTGDDEYYVVRNFHHILLDGWSLGLVNKEFLEFFAAYSENRKLSLEPAKSYKDYISWLKLQNLSEAESFWRERLKGFKRATQIGLETSSGLPSYDEEIVPFPSSMGENLKTLARQNRITLNTMIQATWALLLNGYTGESDVVFGATTSGRPGELPGVEEIVGLFFNTLPVRVKDFPEEGDFGSFAREIQDRQGEQKSYEYCSAGQAHVWSELPSSMPLYESILVFENHPSYSPKELLSNLNIVLTDSRSMGARTKSDLTLLIFLNPELKIKIIYNTKKFDKSRIADIMGGFTGILENIIANPNQNLKKIINVKGQRLKVKRETLDVQREALNVIAPRDELERRLVNIWEDVLGIQPISVRDNFFSLGKHSLVAVNLFSQIQKAFGKSLPISILFQAPTIEGLANVIRQKTSFPISDLLMPIKTGGSKPPFFFIHGCGGEVMFYNRLASYMDEDQPFYGVRARGMYGEKPPHKTIEEMAAFYVREIRKFQPEGPYYIGTVGDGGFVAFEMAQQLLAQNQKVGMLLLIDAIAYADNQARLAQAVGLPNTAKSQDNLVNKPKLTISTFKKAIKNKLGKYKWKFAYSFIPRHIKSIQKHFNYINYVRMYIGIASGSYVPKVYPGKITYFLTEGSQKRFGEFWNKIAAGGLDLHTLPGDHETAWKEPNVKIMAEKLKDCLNKTRNEE